MLGFVLQVDVPEVVLVLCCHLVHLVQCKNICPGKRSFQYLVFSGDAASHDVGGQKDYQEEAAVQKDHQEEAAISSQIGTDYNFSNDGCEI